MDGVNLTMSTYHQSSLPEPLPRDPSGRNRRPTAGGRRRASTHDLFRRRLVAVVLLGLLVAPLVWAMRGDNDGVDVTPTGGAAAVVDLDTSGDTVSADPGDTVAAPATDVVVVDPVESTTTAPEISEPPSTTALAKKVCATNYTVQAGDSWYLIAAKVGVKASLIAGANNRTIKSALMVGQVICLPAGAVIPTTVAATSNTTKSTIPKPACASTYKVVSGDSWYGIAAKVGVAASDLTAANSMTIRSTLRVGDTICLPPGAKAPASTVPKTAGSKSSVVSVRRYSRGELEAIVRAVWPDHLVESAFYVVGRESNWNNLSQNSCCVGIFQLNFNAHKSWMAAYGVTDRSQLLDPEVNARLALATFNRSGSWRPWCTPNWCPAV